MKLNHLDLQVSDVQTTAHFFERFFAFKMLTSSTLKSIAVLEGEGGFSLVLQKLKNPQAIYPEGFHIGFVLENVERVHALFHELKDQDIEVGDAVIVNNRGTMFYFKIPGGILTEVSAKTH